MRLFGRDQSSSLSKDCAHCAAMLEFWAAGLAVLWKKQAESFVLR